MNKERLFSPMFVVIVACTLCCFLVGQGANAGTTVYLERIGSSAELAGMGALIFSLAAAVSRIVSGPLADAHGRRMVMVMGAVVMLVGTVGPLLGNSDALFIVWRILQGFGFAAGTTASATAAADVLPLSRLGEGIGYSGLGQAIAMSIGPALAIFLISTDVPENFYFGLAGCSALALVFALLCTYEKNPQHLPPTAEFRMRWERGDVAYGSPDAPNATQAASGGGGKASSATAEGRGSGGLIDGIFEPTALPGTIPLMLIAASFGFGIFFMGIYGNALGVGNAGVFYTLSAASMIVIRLTSGRFMDKVRPIVIMGAAVVAGLVCYGILLACSQMAPGVACEALFYASGIFYGISLGIAMPINQTIAVRLSPPERWGAANGLYLLGADVSIGIASFAWGLTTSAMGYAVTIVIVMALIAASFVAAVLCYPKEEV